MLIISQGGLTPELSAMRARHYRYYTDHLLFQTQYKETLWIGGLQSFLLEIVLHRWIARRVNNNRTALSICKHLQQACTHCFVYSDGTPVCLFDVRGRL